MMKILIYTREDLKKSGGFKKRFNQEWITKDEFFQYLSENDLKLTKPYMDSYGIISNDELFRCNYKGMIIGTSKIIEEFGELLQWKIKNIL